MFKQVSVGMCFVLIIFAAQAGKVIYKQVDSSGRVSYSDLPKLNSFNLKSMTQAKSNSPISGSITTSGTVASPDPSPVISGNSTIGTISSVIKVPNSAANPPSFVSIVNKDILFHHHIHNFHFNESDKSKSNYMLMHDHALAMSYDATTHYLAAKMATKYDGLNRIMLHNAYYSPVVIDLSSHTAGYGAQYMDKYNMSTINSSRHVWEASPIDSSDIEIIKGYSCAALDDYNSINLSSSDKEIKRLYRTNLEYKRIIANFQSKFVVDDLVKKTIKTLETGNYDILFIDDLPRVVQDCKNKDFGGMGSYTTWKDGQLDFLSRIVFIAHKMKGYHGNPIKIFGNIWSPYADEITPKWYSENKLRLDHYYFESAGSALGKLETFYGQEANGKDPETALPAFVLENGGYIPANLISLGTNINYQYKIATAGSDKGDGYLMQHYKASGTASAQGSWFGWYGETNVDRIYPDGKLVHTNAMQLLRAIPNWDNLASISLVSRIYNKNNNTYVSPNSSFSKSVIQGWNPINQELYVVYMDMKEKVNLKGKVIKTAYFVDDKFNKTSNDAMGCLAIQGEFASLKCTDKLKIGIRITFY